MLIYFVYLLIYIWLVIVFSVKWHRYSLLGDKDQKFFAIGLGKRGRMFLSNTVIIMLLIVVLAIVFELLSLVLLLVGNNILFAESATNDRLFIAFGVGFFLSGPSSIFDLIRFEGLTIIDRVPEVTYALNAVFFVLSAYLVARLSLVYPAITLGFAMRLGDSWKETRGRGFRITLLLIVMSVPAIAGSEIAVQIEPIAGLPVWQRIGLGAFVQSLFLLITTALFAATFSYAYKALDLPLHPPLPHTAA
jgi:hypothetical protein